jgi:hypothetical protein
MIEGYARPDLPSDRPIGNLMMPARVILYTVSDVEPLDVPPGSYPLQSRYCRERYAPAIQN